MAVPIQMCNYLPLIGQLRNPTLSVVVVTQNCAEQLRLMLTTVAPVADEIIVVDGGSSDHTEEVVASFQLARYIERPFRDDIADQKNFAIGQATCDWVCVLDSDETVGQEFRDVVRDLIKSRWHSAYEFPRYWLCSIQPLLHVTSARIYPDYQLRLFRNSSFWRYRRYVDELGIEVGKVHHQFPQRGRGWVKRAENAHLYHFDFVYHDRAAREQKVERYDSMEPSAKDTHRRYYLFEDWPFERVKVDHPLEESVIAQAQAVVAARD